MSFDELFAKVKKLAGSAEINGNDFLAVQVNITGDDGGVFYVEVKDGKINVEPYEYADKQCTVTMKNEDFNKLIDGKLNPIMAFGTGKLKVDGDIGKALAFSKLIEN